MTCTEIHNDRIEYLLVKRDKIFTLMRRGVFFSKDNQTCEKPMIDAAGRLTEVGLSEFKLLITCPKMDLRAYLRTLEERIEIKTEGEDLNRKRKAADLSSQDEPEMKKPRL